MKDRTYLKKPAGFFKYVWSGNGNQVLKGQILTFMSYINTLCKASYIFFNMHYILQEWIIHQKQL